ncbi:MAG: hypothetical protein Kow0029_18160 [Candidatus Rifleibacteriota bacterium]
MISTLNQLFGKKIRAATAPSINAVVVNCEDPDILTEIDKLTKVLDRKPAILKYSVQRISEGESSTNRLTLGKDGNFKLEHQRTNESGVHSVIATEYRKARLTEDSIRIFTVPAYYGNIAETLTISHGLMISGHLAGTDSAIIELWYSSGQNLDSEAMLTSLSVPLGQWVSIGGANADSSQTSPTLELGENSEFVRRKSNGLIDRRYLIKVDLVRY